MSQFMFSDTDIGTGLFQVDTLLGGKLLDLPKT